MAWLRSFCSEPSTWHRAIGRSLSKAGVVVTERPHDPACPGIVDDPRAKVVAAVRDRAMAERKRRPCRRGYRARRGFAWQLLQAGASDVFALDDSNCVPAEDRGAAGAVGGGRFARGVACGARARGRP